MARVIPPLLARGAIDESGLLSFLERLAGEHPIGCSEPRAYARSTNFLNFARALYFYIDEGRPSLRGGIEGLIRRMMRIS